MSRLVNITLCTVLIALSLSAVSTQKTFAITTASKEKTLHAPTATSTIATSTSAATSTIKIKIKAKANLVSHSNTVSTSTMAKLLKSRDAQLQRLASSSATFSFLNPDDQTLLSEEISSTTAKDSSIIQDPIKKQFAAISSRVLSSQLSSTRAINLLQTKLSSLRLLSSMPFTLSQTDIHTLIVATSTKDISGIRQKIFTEYIGQLRINVAKHDAALANRRAQAKKLAELLASQATSTATSTESISTLASSTDMEVVATSTTSTDDASSSNETVATSSSSVATSTDAISTESIASSTISTSTDATSTVDTDSASSSVSATISTTSDDSTSNNAPIDMPNDATTTQ